MRLIEIDDRYYMWRKKNFSMKAARISCFDGSVIVRLT